MHRIKIIFRKPNTNNKNPLKLIRQERREYSKQIWNEENKTSRLQGNQNKAQLQIHNKNKFSTINLSNKYLRNKNEFIIYQLIYMKF